MPQVTIRTGFFGKDGQEEILSEYLCDWPDCPNIAVHVVSTSRDTSTATAVCSRHAAEIKAQSQRKR